MKQPKKYAIRRDYEFAHLSSWNTTDDVFYFELSNNVQKALDDEIRHWSSASAWYSKGREFSKVAKILHDNLQSAEDYGSVDEIVTFLFGSQLTTFLREFWPPRGCRMRSWSKRATT